MCGPRPRHPSRIGFAPPGAVPAGRVVLWAAVMGDTSWLGDSGVRVTSLELCLPGVLAATAPPDRVAMDTPRIYRSSPSSAFSTTSGSAGWIQYWPVAISRAPSPNDIAWISGWITDDACGPMM